MTSLFRRHFIYDLTCLFPVGVHTDTAWDLQVTHGPYSVETQHLHVNGLLEGKE